MNATTHAIGRNERIEPRPPVKGSAWLWPVRVLAVVFLVALWLFASIPWGFSAFTFLVFTAPGAVIGIAMAWMSRVFERGHWDWRAGLTGALIGGSFLPPVLAFMVSLTGASGSPRDLLTLFVLTPWFALAVGVVIGLVRRFWRDNKPVES